MPIYDYRCIECTKVTERFQHHYTDEHIRCVCGGRMKRAEINLFNFTGFAEPLKMIDKGNGWSECEW